MPERYWKYPQADDRKVTSLMDNIVSPHDDLNHTPFYRKGKLFWRKTPKPVSRIVEPGKQYCPSCENDKDSQQFISKNGKPYSYCQECRNKKQRDQYTVESGRHRNLLRTYGLSKEEYESMLARQGGVCACCGQPETIVHGRSKQVQHLSVDHNHATGQVRELLCNTCNNLVGYLEADSERVQKAIHYLKRHDK